VAEDLTALDPGWSFVSVSCDDGFAETATPVDGSVTVDLPPGSDVTCTFINEYVPEEEPVAALTIRLVTRGGAGEFEFNGQQVGAFILKTLAQAGIIDPEAVTTFADLAPGTYGIAEKTLPAFWHTVSATCDNGDSPTVLTLLAGDDVTCTFVVEKDAPSAQVGDTVFLDLNGNGKQDPGEKGINGAKVFLLDSTGTLVGTVTTANGGVYLFTGLAPGKYTVKLDPKSVTGQLTTAGAFTFDLAEGVTYLDADFGLAETLPKTGTDAAALGLLGLMLLAAGAIAVMATRKKREQS
jgi:LPXTG-motif cell wall-anchored protein